MTVASEWAGYHKALSNQNQQWIRQLDKKPRKNMTTYFNEITLVLQRSEIVWLISHYRDLEIISAESQDYLAAHQAKLRADGLAKIMDEAHD